MLRLRQSMPPDRVLYDKRGEKIEKLIVIYVTCGSDEEAGKLSDGLLSNRLAACVNIADVKSVFEWKGKIEKENERLLIIKSIRSNFDKIEKYVRANHSYECPEIIAMDITAASENYASWVRSACLPGKNIEDSGEG